MAQYQHLPIYKKTYDLLSLVTREIKNFPRDFRYTLGARLHGEVVSLVVSIYKANAAKDDRQHFLRIMLDQLQVVVLLLRLCRDMRLFSIKRFSDTVVLTESIGRQTSGWSKSSLARAES